MAGPTTVNAKGAVQVVAMPFPSTLPTIKSPSVMPKARELPPPRACTWTSAALVKLGLPVSMPSVEIAGISRAAVTGQQPGDDGDQYESAAHCMTPVRHVKERSA